MAFTLESVSWTHVPSTGGVQQQSLPAAAIERLHRTRRQSLCPVLNSETNTGSHEMQRVGDRWIITEARGRRVYDRGLDRSGMGRASEHVHTSVEVEITVAHEVGKICTCIHWKVKQAKKNQSPPLECRCRRSIVCRRLLLQQLARAKAAF